MEKRKATISKRKSRERCMEVFKHEKKRKRINIQRGSWKENEDNNVL